MPGFPVLHQLLELFKLMSIELVMPSSRLILCQPLVPFCSCPELSLSAMIFLKRDLLWGAQAASSPAHKGWLSSLPLGFAFQPLWVSPAKTQHFSGACKLTFYFPKFFFFFF